MLLCSFTEHRWWHTQTHLLSRLCSNHRINQSWSHVPSCVWASHIKTHSLDLVCERSLKSLCHQRDWLTAVLVTEPNKNKKIKKLFQTGANDCIGGMSLKKKRKLLLSRGRKWKPCTEVATHWASCPPTPCKQRPINSSNFGSNRRVCAKLLLNFSEALKSASDREDPHW